MITLVYKVFVSFIILGVPYRFCDADHRNNFEIFTSRRVFEKQPISFTIIVKFKNTSISYN